MLPMIYNLRSGRNAHEESCPGYLWLDGQSVGQFCEQSNIGNILFFF